MFKLRGSDKSSKKRNLHKSTPSVIAADMNILGNVISEGMLDIHGSIEGNVRCHSAFIREESKIKGDVIAESIDIYGEVEGLVKAKIVNLHESAMVRGVIMHEAITIEDGAVIDGKLKRTDKVFMGDLMDEIEALTPMSARESIADRLEKDVFDKIRLVSG